MNDNTIQETSNLKIFWILSVFAVVVLFIFVTLYFINLEKDTTSYSEEVLHEVTSVQDLIISAAELDTSSELQLQETIGVIIETKDISACESIDNTYYRIVCINNIALQLARENQDIEYCKFIDGTLISAQECIQPVLDERSVEREDVSVCAEGADAEIQNNCEVQFHLSLAIKKNDVSFCDGEKDSDRRISCINRFLLQQINFDNLSADMLRCDAFEADAVNDCFLIAGAINKRTPEAVFESCQAQQTTVFASLCSDPNTLLTKLVSRE